MAINSKIVLSEIDIPVSVRHPGGWKTISVRMADVDTFNADPDRYAADHFGMTVAQYVEWVELDGSPLCGANTQAGRPCKAVVGKIQLSSHEWLRLHREQYCKTHGG